MGSFLRQATASQSRALGPFLDDTDFKTPETGLTINSTDVKLVVNGAASANKNSGGGTHRVNGVYGFTFDATDTATVGEMDVSVVVSGALPVFDKFFVVEEAVYDALYASSAQGFGNIKRSTAKSGFEFMMTDSTTHNPVTGKTVSVTRSIDGGSFSAGTLSAVTEVGVGIYSVDFAANDLAGGCIMLRATATGADDTFVRIITSLG